MNPDWSELHRVFHAALLAGCGSRWLMDFNDLLSIAPSATENLLAVMGTVRDVLSEHRAIAEAAIERKTAWPSGCSTIITRRRVGRCPRDRGRRPHGALIGATG